MVHTINTIMTVMSGIFKVLFLFLAVAAADGICPGYNFAIRKQSIKAGNYLQFSVVNDACQAINEVPICTTNPCDCPNFGCSPAPAHIDHIFVGGLYYACRTDPNQGNCPFMKNNDDIIESCVSFLLFCFLYWAFCECLFTSSSIFVLTHA